MAKNKISLSAWIVILSHSILSRNVRWKSLPPEADLPFYNSCLDYCRNHSWLCRILGGLPDGIKLFLIQRMVAFGAPQHFVLRKRAIVRQVRSSVAAGVKQVVVIGAGFDVLAFNTATEFPQVTCIELDTPFMQQLKLQLLNQRYGHIPPNFYSSGVDLAITPLHSALAVSPGFRADVATLYVAEGLLMYLSEENVKTLFTDIRKVSPSSVDVIFTAITNPSEATENLWSAFRKMLLGYNSEAFSWNIHRSAMPGFLKQCGFSQHYQLGYSELQNGIRSELEIARLDKQKGEYVVYATMDAVLC